MSTLAQLAHDFAVAHPKRVDPDTGLTYAWPGWCASEEFQFNRALVAYRTATLAGNATRLISADPTQAPIGAKHYWGSGAGHVATEVGGRGRKLFMASARVDEAIVYGLGFISFDRYKSKVSLPYRGWGLTYGANRTITGDDSGKLGDPVPASGGIGAGYHYYDPTGSVARRIQFALKRRGRYSGAVDGVFGPKTRMGIQATIRSVGYAGPIDGVIQGVGCRLIQVYAQKFGSYVGPIDGALGPNSWAGFALGLERP